MYEENTANHKVMNNSSNMGIEEWLHPTIYEWM